ncbi:LytTR family DNA-binding domain-containing protein [Nemorincola caseinilytica]|uniref:LytTR family DNA-binding domain-containing protein n=1 Tax=Nemorincola caseinilytica TaxID=2054315 RepID=A0ABP8NNR9_9BACT
MITAIIIDDEPKSVFTLKCFLEEHCPSVKVVAVAGSARSGKEFIESLQPQLVFLDIEMPMGSGFDLLRSLPKIDFEIIFITAYNQYAINAFRFSAVDYLLKPLRIPELVQAVEKAEARIRNKVLMGNYELLMRNMSEKNAARQKISFTERGEQYMVPVEDLSYLVADGNYTHVHTADKVYLTTRTLKEFEDLLPPGMFCRIHHGYIVNLDHIAKVQKGRGGAVVMKDGKVLEIAIRRKEAFKKAFDKA